MTPTPPPLLPQEKPLYKSLLSARDMHDAIMTACKRFPITVIQLGLLTLFLLAVTLGDPDLTASCYYAITWETTVGALLSLAIGLWLEYSGNTAKAFPAQIAGLLVVLADSVMIYLRTSVITEAEWAGRAAVVTALAVAILFLPKGKGMGASDLWNYTVHQISLVAMACALSIVLMIASMIIYGTIGILFSFYSEKLFVVLLIIFAMTLPSLIYVSMLPRPSQIVGYTVVTAKSAFPAACKNVLLPLTCVYTAILYVYLIKILVTWELPKGNVCYMVTGLVMVALVVLYGMRGYQFDASATPLARRISDWAARWLPLLMLPLLALMSVAIFYRLGQYGITASRLYVMTFNLWAYAVVIYLIIRRQGNLNIVAASFATVFLLTSVIPGLNYCSIANGIIRHKLEAALERNGITGLPITLEAFKAKIQTVDKEEAKDIVSYLEYLDTWEDHSQVSDLVISKSKINGWQFNLDRTDSALEFHRLSATDSEIVIPTGFSRIKTVTSSELNDTIGGKDYATINDVVYFVDTDSVVKASDKEGLKPFAIRPESGADSTMVICTGVTYYTDDDGNVTGSTASGYLFTR